LTNIKKYPKKSALRSFDYIKSTPAKIAPTDIIKTPSASKKFDFFLRNTKSVTNRNKVVSLLNAKKTGMLTLLIAVIPDITLAKKLSVRGEHFIAISKEKTGTFHILGIPSGLMILKIQVNATPYTNWHKSN
jgi:hypothetical protein